MPYVEGQGETFDIHALRGQFVTEMDRAGVSLVKAQGLARHSSPNLAASLNTRLRMEDLKPEVDKLPWPPMVFPRPASLHSGLHKPMTDGFRPIHRRSAMRDEIARKLASRLWATSP
ncbi:MAG: hypothetical protein NVSMB9_18200 [Isosphaeraceae bacterium]